MKITPKRMVVLMLLAMISVVISLETSSHAQTVFNVKNFGTTGNGSTIDTPAINRAIDAANRAGGGTVLFPAGTYLSGSIHLRSNVTLQLDSGATIRAASSGIDAPEPNSFSQFQDFGHSHFHNALIWGENLQNIGITGAGTIDGDGLTTSNDVPSGRGDKAISLKLCMGVRITDVTIRRGGHFAILANGCGDMTLARLTVATSNDRDGINIINCRNVEISDSDIRSSDDALVFKSDFALGRTFPSENIHVRNSTILSTENNALQFGSETCGDFRNVTFSNITILGAGKAGIGVTTNDGAVIEDISYSDITMVRASSPIFMKISDRGNCPGSPPVGRIRNIRITNVTGTNLIQPGGNPDFTSTITGKPGIPIENVTLTNVRLAVPGGHPSSDSNIVPPENDRHLPRLLGTRPSYGWWLRHIRGVTFRDCEVSFDSNDGRPAFIADDGASIILDGFRAERGSSSPYDVGFKGVNGFLVANGSTTSGSALRIRAVNSTPLPPPGGEFIWVEAENALVSAPMQVLSDANASGGRYVTVAAGNNSKTSPPDSGHVTVDFSVSAAGSYKVWARVIAPTVEDDSFWVRMDGGAWIKWNEVSLGSSWHWDEAHNSDAGDAGVTFNLAAGSHTLTFAYREDGARLDRLLITNDTTFIPSGVGPVM
jgi:Glycosyl hydrolases family 28